MLGLDCFRNNDKIKLSVRANCCNKTFNINEELLDKILTVIDEHNNRVFKPHYPKAE